MAKHDLPPPPPSGYPLGTVWFDYGYNAWLKRSTPSAYKVIATAEQVDRLRRARLSQK